MLPCTAALSKVQAPAPACAIDLTDDDAASAAAVADASSVCAPLAAKHRIDSALLALARSIRRTRAYVGYSAFTLMGLLHKCQPCLWEGFSCINLIQTFAPEKLDECERKLALDGIPCTLEARDAGLAVCVPISPLHPLEGVGHYVAGATMPCLPCSAAAVAEDDVPFETFYAALGIATIASICDGDCALDVMCLMLGLPRTLAARNDLRIEISDYLIQHIDARWMHEMMGALQEVDWEDVQLYWKAAVEIVPASNALAAVAEAVDDDVLVID